ncbi:MAG: cell division protein FtsQ/DivIB [Ilumatobacteraceae bacterium]
MSSDEPRVPDDSLLSDSVLQELLAAFSDEPRPAPATPVADVDRPAAIDDPLFGLFGAPSAAPVGEPPEARPVEDPTPSYVVGEVLGTDGLIRIDVPDASVDPPADDPVDESTDQLVLRVDDPDHIRPDVGGNDVEIGDVEIGDDDTGELIVIAIDDDDVMDVGLLDTETGGPSTIVIVGDDRPDTVYLDEAKEERLRAVHGGSTVDDPDMIVIDDLDEGMVVNTPPVASGGSIDPRLRARRAAVRRAAGRRRLVVLVAAVAAVLLVVLAIAFVASPVFDVRDITVQGAVYTDRSILDEVVADLEGSPVLLVDTLEIEERLAAAPWVESAIVTRDFPHTVFIDIRERVALATFQGGDGRWRVIDVEGRVLDVLDGQPIAYMQIVGDHPDTGRGLFAGAPYAAAALLVKVLPPEVRAVTRWVGLDDVSGTLTLTLAGGVDPTAGIEVRLGSVDGLDQKLARLLTQVRSGLDGIVSLDVSTTEIGVVRG